MAIYPCAVGSHRYGGPQQSAYLGVAIGGLSARSKLRLCSPHFRDLMRYCEAAMALVVVGETETGDATVDDTTCFAHREVATTARAFATLYPIKDEARIYFAALCGACEEAFRRVGQIELS